MSLIHQALRDMDPPLAADAAALAPRSAPAPARGRRGPLLALVGALAVAVAGLAGWHALRTGRPLASAAAPAATPPAVIASAVAASMPPAPAASAAPVQAPLPAVSPAPAVSDANAAPVPVPTAVAAPVATTVPAAPEPVAQADAAPVRRPAPARVSVQPPAERPRGGSRAAVPPARPSQGHPAAARVAVSPAAPASAPAAMPVEQRFNAFLQAMRAGDLPGAGQHLAALRRELSPGSVSLLRAEGWYALAGGDAGAAARIYQDILDRLPGDEEASINLASIEARRDRAESARKILADAVRLHPESESLKAALARFQAKP
ncbi:MULTISPECIES: tetratricopeptide repeat protein [Comamonadaceae]|uniref:tetratricopeptide repeat protein n=1 Tax=Acidovorax sacchari TaxID=3230736 RepID=UPI0034A19CD8